MQSPLVWPDGTFLFRTGLEPNTNTLKEKRNTLTYHTLSCKVAYEYTHTVFYKGRVRKGFHFSPVCE